MATDSAIAWAFRPGDGRTPRRATQAQFAALIDAWIAGVRNVRSGSEASMTTNLRHESRWAKRLLASVPAHAVHAVFNSRLDVSTARSMMVSLPGITPAA